MFKRKGSGKEKRRRVYIDGMVNSRSEMRITSALCAVQGISFIDVKVKKGYADVYYVTFYPTEQVRKAIEHLGYKVIKEEDVM